MIKIFYLLLSKLRVVKVIFDFITSAKPSAPSSAILLTNELILLFN